MRHFTGLAHIALYTKNLESTIQFYENLGGELTDRAEVQKPSGTNRLAMIRLAGFFLEIIEPHDGTIVTEEGGLIPHIAIQVDDIDSAVADAQAVGINTFRTDQPIEMSVFGGIKNIFFTGPNGELIEFLQPLS